MLLKIVFKALNLEKINEKKRLKQEFLKNKKTNQ
jgi:hypothetical protein